MTKTSKIEIFNLLKIIHKSNQLVSVSFDSLPQYCLTMLLEVHYDAKVIVFDESNPQISKKLLTSKKEAEFSLKLDNLPLVFKSELIHNSKNENLLYAHFPKEIYYPQHRKSFRLKTEFMKGINAKIYLKSRQELNCVVVNISVYGLCLRIPHPDSPVFHVDKLLDDIQIKLPDSSIFSVSAKIQFKRYEYKSANLIVGLHIQEQRSSIEKAIQQFIYAS